MKDPVLDVSGTLLMESKYQSLLQTIEGIVWEADAKTFEFSFVSDKVKSILGYTPEEWRSTPDFWKDHIYEEDRAQAVNFCHVQTQMSRSHTFDYRMIKADGSIIWIKDIVSVITDNGNPSLLRGIMVDITDSKLLEQLDHLEKEVLELNSRKDTDIETVLKVYVRGIEGLFSRMKCSILKVKDDKVHNWASPSLPAEYVDAIDDMLIGPYAGSCGTAAFLKQEVIVNDIENDPKWAAHKHVALPFGLRACWSYPIIDSYGIVIAVLGIYYNTVQSPDQSEQAIIQRSATILTVILENRLYAEMMREMNLLISQGQELANFGNWQWDISANKVSWSSVLYRIYGLNENTFPATFEGYLGLLHADDKERVYGIIRGALEMHNDVVFEERIVRPEGKVRYLKSWGRVILNDAGEPVKMIGACLDITNAKTVEIKMEEIAWMQSHVIRAPLARLMGLVDMLHEEIPANFRNDELLAHIMNSAHELDNVIKNISEKTYK